MAAKRKIGHDGLMAGAAEGQLRASGRGIEDLARSALDRLAQSSRDVVEARIVPPPQIVDIEAFVDAVLGGNVDHARNETRRLLDNGASYEWIADVMIAGAARSLGRKWETNQLSFIDVSLGVSTLLRINSEVRTQARGDFRSQGALAIFATLEGQTHNLGIILAAEAFRQHAWDVDLMLDKSVEDIVHHVRTCQPTIVGLTAGRNDRLRDIAELLARLKALKPSPRTLLGGHAAVDKPILERLGDADVTVTSIEDALAAAGPPN